MYIKRKDYVMNIQTQTNKSSPNQVSRSISGQFLDNPLSFLDSQSEPYKEVLNAVLVIDNKKKTGEAYIDELCSLSGYKRTCVKKYLDLLIKDGFIGKVGRYHKASLFRVNAILHLPHIRTLLSPFLRALCFLPFAFLTSTFFRCYTPERPLQLKDLYIKNKINNSIGTKDTQLSVSRVSNPQKLMNILKQYTNMSKRTESDNKPANPWNIPQRERREPQRSYQRREDGFFLGSVESDYTRARKRMELEDQIKREFALEVKKDNLMSAEEMQADLATKAWMR